MSDERFAALVSLACHDLRTPLSTVNGAVKTLLRSGELGEQETRLASMADAAATELAALLDRLGLAARIAAGRYEPTLVEADTLGLARGEDERVAVGGQGTTVSTDAAVVSAALSWFATATLRHGAIDAVAWSVAGRRLALAPLPAEAAPIVEGSSPRDLGALVARSAIEALGGSVRLERGALIVELAG